MLTPQLTYYRILNFMELNRGFLAALLQSSAVQTQLRILAGHQSTRDYVSLLTQRELVLLLPPIDEQRKISQRVDAATSHLRMVCQRIRDGIARLQEYRTALISAAVTGQIDVRGEVTP
jgi:type I restriction enzyme S subunit